MTATEAPKFTVTEAHVTGKNEDGSLNIRVVLDSNSPLSAEEVKEIGRLGVTVWLAGKRIIPETKIPEIKVEEKPPRPEEKRAVRGSHPLGGSLADLGIGTRLVLNNGRVARVVEHSSVGRTALTYVQVHGQSKDGHVGWWLDSVTYLPFDDGLPPTGFSKPIAVVDPGKVTP